MTDYLKNIFIAFLVILAVYQTNKLWFEDFSSHNFFEDVLSFGKIQGSAESIEHETEYIGINNGNNKYILTYELNSVKQIKVTLNKAVKAAVDKNSRQIFGLEKLNEIMGGRNIIIKYAFKADERFFSQVYGENIISGEYDSIIVGEDDEGITVTFLNSQELEGITYLLKNYAGAKDIAKIIDSVKSSNNVLYYVSSLQNGYDVFAGNELIPTWSGEAYYYNITKQNPVEDKGELVSARLDSYVSRYFDNPVLKWSSMEGETYIFSDENTVVKYYPTGVLEYNGYYGESKEKTGDTGSFLAAAESFLNSDSNLKNEYYLKGCSNDVKGMTFYFDYKINNYKLELSDTVKKNTGLKSFIEVTVDGGRVVGYKRYAMDYATTVKDPVYTGKTFLEVIDRGLNKLKGEQINSFGLSYMETGSESIYLYYIAEIDGSYYFEKAF